MKHSRIWCSNDMINLQLAGKGLPDDMEKLPRFNTLSDSQPYYTYIGETLMNICNVTRDNGSLGLPDSYVVTT